MKTIRLILIIIGTLIVIAVIAGLILVRGIKHSAIPTYEGEINIKGITSDVTVFRDERGMPHIYADNEADLYFAVGYVMSEERLWQMDLIRRATTGRLSEIFGKDYVMTDLFLRSLNMTAKSKIVLKQEDPEILSCLESFARGVNSYITAAGNKLPPEFIILGYKPETWCLEDITNIIGYMGWDLAAENLFTDIFNYRLIKKLGPEKAEELIPDWKADTGSVFPKFKLNDDQLKKALERISEMDKLKPLGIVSFSGSNNWVVDGSRSETGKPIFSNDMHLGLSSPGIWFQMHQVIPGKLNVTGVAVPGEPFIVAGHNERIAWGMTNLMVDDIDLFAERINPENADQYFFNGEWRNMSVRNEVIKIKGDEADTLVIKFTHHGPIVSDFRDIKDASLAMRWSGFDMSDELKSVYLLNRASQWDEFRNAISFFRSVSQNFAYADVDGNIGLNTGGGIPLRKGNGSIIRNGETDEFDWKGYVPFDQLPFCYNPQEGSVSSANNKTVGNDYPYYIAFRFAVPYRINRIRKMLGEKKLFGIGDFKRMVTDQHSEYASLVIPYMLKLNDKIAEMSNPEKEALKELTNWDYNMSKDLVAPTVLEFFTKSFEKNLLGDELGGLFDDLQTSIKEYYIFKILTTGPDSWVDDVTTSEDENLDDIIFKSFKESIGLLSEKYGSDINDWKWGKIHKISLEHPLSSVKILNRVFKLSSPLTGIGGSSHTVCPYYYEGEFKVTSGASQRHIYNTADWDESYSIIPTGESGIPGSEFYLSQTNTYLEVGFYRDLFSRQAVEAAAKYKLLLLPGGN